MSDDLGYRLDTLVQPYTGDLLREGGMSWGLVIRADGCDSLPGYPFIALDLAEKQHERVTAQLTSADARVLARHLTHLADAIDLES